MGGLAKIPINGHGNAEVYISSKHSYISAFGKRYVQDTSTINQELAFKRQLDRCSKHDLINFIIDMVRYGEDG